MNLTLLMVTRFYEAGKLLQPHYNIHSYTELGEINDVVKLPDVAVSTFSNYINEGIEA